MPSLKKPTQRLTQSKSTQIAILLGLLILGRLSYFTEPFGISVDESVYMTLAEATQTGTLYIDAVDRKPPGLIALYRFIGELSSPWNIHAVHIVFIFLTLLLALSAGALISNPKEKLWAVFLFAIFSSCFPREIISANAEIPMTLILSLSVALLVKNIERPKVEYVFWATLLAAVSTLFKQYSAIIFALVYFAWMRAVGFKSKKMVQIQFQSLAVSVGALLIVYGATSLYFLEKNAFREFLYYFLWDGLKFISESRSVKNHDTSLGLAILGMLVSWPFLWWGFSKSLKKKISKNDSIFLAGFVGALITALLSGRYYTHYFVPVIFFLSVIAAPQAQKIISKFRRLGMSAIVLPFIVFSVTNFDRDRYKDWSFSKQRQAELQEVGTWIREHSADSDRIVVWGMAAQLYVISQRGSASRFVFSDFVSGRQPGFKSAESVPVAGAEAQFLGDLEKNKPLYFVDTSPAALNDYGNFPLSRFPAIESYVMKNFEETQRIREYRILKRRVLPD